MSRDESWRFLVLGRSLERVDMTARLLSPRYGERWGQMGWVTTLRSCSAYEAYLRTYQRSVDGSSAAEFLVLDRLFSRSIYFSLRTAENCLGELDPSAGRAGVDDVARRHLGQARAQLRVHLGPGPRGGFGLLPDVCPETPSGRQCCYLRKVFQTGRRRGVERMSWRLEISHVTRYRYDRPVVASYNEARARCRCRRPANL